MRLAADSVSAPAPTPPGIAYMSGAESPPHALLDRGRESRRGVMTCLMDTPGQTEEEGVASTGLSKSTVRNAAGTNDAVLTKDGRMLRMEEQGLGKVPEQYRRVLKGVELETMRLDEHCARFYPDLRAKSAQRPVF